MITPELLGYIKQQQLAGVGDAQIRTALLAQGWQEAVIEQALSQTTPALGATKLPSVGTLLRQALTIYRVRFKTIIGIIVVQKLIMSGLVAIYALNSLAGLVFMNRNNLLLNIGLTIIVTIILILGMIIAQAWGEMALLFSIMKEQSKITTSQAYRLAWPQIFSYWWINLLLSLAIIGGSFLLILPGIIVAINFGFAIFVLADQNVKGISALRLSQQYVKGKWWTIFERYFFLSLITLIVVYLPSLIFEYFKQPLLGSISQAVVGFLFLPFVSIYSYLVYLHAKQT